MADCPICDGGNKTLTNALLEDEGVACASQIYSIPESVLRQHIKHSPELRDIPDEPEEPLGVWPLTATGGKKNG